MSYQDTEPASEGVMPEIRYGDIELDKSEDGRYWQVVYWPDDTVVLRLRIVHSCCEDPSDFVAEARCSTRTTPLGDLMRGSRFSADSCLPLSNSSWTLSPTSTSFRISTAPSSSRWCGTGGG